VILGLCVDNGLSSRDLATLEAVACHFRLASMQLQNTSGQATVPECAAELQVRASREGWRLERRPGESWKRVLLMVENGVLAPLSVVAAAPEHTLVRAVEGWVFAFGHNDWKQLGLGDSDAMVAHNTMAGHDMSEFTAELGYPRGGNSGGPPWRQDIEASPREVERLRGRRVVSVAAGQGHSAALTEEGALLTWGSGGATNCSNGVRYDTSSWGQLGHGPVLDKYPSVVSAPRVVTGFPVGVRVALVAAAGHHTACITAMGEVFSWGDGENGQLGHGNKEHQHTPKRVDALVRQRVVDLDCNSEITAVVTSAGQLFSWGEFAWGEWLSSHTPKQVTFPGGALVRRVSCGFRFMAAVDTDGVLYTWGAAEYYRLGHGSEFEDEEAPRAVDALANQRVAAVSCGSTHTAAVTETGHLWTWGGGARRNGTLGLEETWYNDPNIWGTPDDDKYVSFGQVPTRVTAGLPGGETANTAYDDGPSDSEGELVTGVGVVRQVRCGDQHTVVVMVSGEVCTCGDPTHGKLGHEGLEVVDPRGHAVFLPREVEGLLACEPAAAAAWGRRRAALECRRAAAAAFTCGACRRGVVLWPAFSLVTVTELRAMLFAVPRREQSSDHISGSERGTEV
jgi:alpha-tubulin suppressor-like RCC1 family protein